MILLWSFCGIAAAYCIGRNNQSNKLFWVLFTSFVVGIAGAAVYNKCTQSSKEEIRVTQVSPMQDDSMPMFVTIDIEQAECNNMPAPAGKEILPEYYSNIVGHQWINQPTIPPPRA